MFVFLRRDCCSDPSFHEEASVFPGGYARISFKHVTEIVHILKSASGGNLLKSKQIAGKHLLSVLDARVVEVMNGGLAVDLAKEGAQMRWRAACRIGNLPNADVLIEAFLYKEFCSFYWIVTTQQRARVMLVDDVAQNLLYQGT